MQKMPEAGAVRRPVIGVLGGLGPWATLHFFELVLRLTPASRDQEHLRVIIDNNPTIPDRGPAILGHGEDPTPALVATARNLEEAGADFIVIPCNTAHAFYDKIKAAVRVPVLHIMEEVAQDLAGRRPPVRKAGVLATRATVAAALYDRALREKKIDLVVPPPEDQKVIDRLIYAIKAQDVGPELQTEATLVARRLADRGAEVLILGCTELPLALEGGVGVPLIDSTRVLAEAAVREATAVIPPLPA